MLNRIAFQNRMKYFQLYDKVTPHQMKGMFAIIDEFEKRGLTDLRWLAYILATVYHETGRTFEPIEEIGKGSKRPYGKKLKQSGEAYSEPDELYYGRGLVQLTWYENYDKFSDIVGEDLLEMPGALLNMDISIKVLFEGMIRGLFTGRKLSDYFNVKKEDWVNARKIINGKDQAAKIAVYAKNYLSAIKYS